MHHPFALFLLLASVFAISVHSLQHSLPPDPYAFPKYRVTFLKNISPIENHTALRWLSDGLKGGQLEFLDQWHPIHFKEIESGSIPESTQDSRQVPIVSDQHEERISEPSSSPVLELLRLGQRSYLCLIPPPPPVVPESPAEDQAPITPTHSWSLLQPLSGTCLYVKSHYLVVKEYPNFSSSIVRHGSRTPIAIISMSDNSENSPPVTIKQQWESYTLGRSPLAKDATDGENISRDELTIANNNLELAHHQAEAGQRYLVQRWGDGTPCDKTGRPREVEIQFHCSMTMTDTIMFVKETRTCEYVLVINTPRLCGEPGFKSHLDQAPEAEIQCREVLNENDESNHHHHPSSSSSPEEQQQQQQQEKLKHPFRRIPRPPVLSPTKTGEHQGSSDKKGGSGSGNVNKGFDDQFNLLIQKALEQVAEKMFGSGGDLENEGFSVIEIEGLGGGDDDGGDLRVIAALNINHDLGKGQSESEGVEESGGGESEIVMGKSSTDRERLAKVLRNAGFEVQWKDDEDDAAAVEEDNGNEQRRVDKTHDEL